MNEPLMTYLGIKASALVAGFAGGLVSLAFIKQATLRQSVLVLMVGMLTAAFLTPPIGAYFSLSAQFENALGFVIGVSAMGLIPAIKRAVTARASAIINAAASSESSGSGDAGKGGSL